MLSRLSGTVRDRSGLPIVAVTVSARSPSLIGGARVVTTDQEGRYRLGARSRGVRSPHVACWLRCGRLLEYPADAGASVDVDGVLDIAPVSERVDVVAPPVDVRTSASTQELDLPLLEHLPTPVTFMRSSISLLVCPRARGSEGRRARTPCGSMALTSRETTTQTPWASFSYNWAEGMQVVAPGAPAEYGQFTGVGASYALRSGSNRLSGLFEVLHPPSSWVAHNTPVDRRLAAAMPGTQRPAWRSSPEGSCLVFPRLPLPRTESRPAFYTGPGSTIAAHPEALLKLTASPGRMVRLDGFSNTDTRSSRPTGSDSTRSMEPRTSASRRPAGTFVRHGRPDRATSSISGPAGYRVSQRFDPHPPATRSGPYPHYDEITGIESRNIQAYTEKAEGSSHSQWPGHAT